MASKHCWNWIVVRFFLFRWLDEWLAKLVSRWGILITRIFEIEEKNIWIIVMYFFQMIIIIRCGNHHVSIFSWQFSVALLIYFSSFIIISITCCQILCYYYYHFNFDFEVRWWWALIREKEIQFSVQQFWQKKITKYWANR